MLPFFLLLVLLEVLFESCYQLRLVQLNLWLIYSFYLRRTPTTIYVRESHIEKVGHTQDVSYEILNVLEFNRWVMSSYTFSDFFSIGPGTLIISWLISLTLIGISVS